MTVLQPQKVCITRGNPNGVLFFQVVKVRVSKYYTSLGLLTKVNQHTNTQTHTLCVTSMERERWSVYFIHRCDDVCAGAVGTAVVLPGNYCVD